MDKQEFLKKIFNLYSNSVKTENAALWGEAYNTVLSDNIDYDALYEFVISNYSGSSMPKPAYLKENATIKKIHKQHNNVNFPTIIGEINGNIYEFGQVGSFVESKYFLEKKGFKNIRLKFEN